MFTRLHSLGLGLFILTTTACPPQEGESTSDDSTGSATDAATDATEPTGGDDSTSTTDGATSVDPTAEPTSTPTTVDTASDTTAGDDSDSDSDSDSDTDTAGPIEILPECQALCDKFAECGLGDDTSCPAECSEGIAAESAECQEAIMAGLSCQGSLTCEQIIEALSGGNDPCAESNEQINTICESSQVCSEGGGGGPGECDYSRDCRGEVAYAMTCDDEMCVCTVDGMESGSCKADAVCDDPEVANLEVKFQECCGF